MTLLLGFLCDITILQCDADIYILPVIHVSEHVAVIHGDTVYFSISARDSSLVPAKCWVSTLYHWATFLA